jgi:hypothetical protein
MLLLLLYHLCALSERPWRARNMPIQHWIYYNFARFYLMLRR